jgi:hypothetical protein
MKIEIIKPFGDAFELMKRILFQPFDLGKWCVIALAAFLTGHAGGSGYGFNLLSSFVNPRATSAERDAVDWPWFEEWKPWLPVIIAVAAVIFLALIMVFGWLKARANFIFTDCIVRNRGAFAEPWREYRREGNSYFLFSLLLFLASLILFGIAGLILFLTGAFASAQSDQPAVLIVIMVIFFIVWIPLAIVVGLTTYFMTPVMYVQRCRAMDAFRIVFQLIMNNSGPFILLCLFGIVLVIALVIASLIVGCLTCCVAAIPYVGTVIMLPAFVWLHAFGLLFLRQFGPEYDVFARSTSSVSSEPPPLPA